MTTFADASPSAPTNERFFVHAAFGMAAVIAVGFSVQLGMGRSSFSAPPLVHAHAVVFMGWIAIYLLQNVFVAGGRTTLHRRFGWVGAVWIVPMMVLGCMVTVEMARRGAVPFFFRPLHFVVFDPVALFTFAGLTLAAIVLRRRTEWHRRLHFCGTAVLLGPGFGRLLPMPLLVPWAFEATFLALMIFPALGVVRDLRRTGRVHPAWLVGIGVMIASLLATEAITYSPLGDGLYRAVTAGSPGASVPPLEFPTPPGGPLLTSGAAGS